ncbi:MAG: BTAD domain-containing putative transcriptional regulator [Nitrospirota bacterium]
MTGRRNPYIVKITRPDTRGIIPRQRLFQELDNMEDAPVVWITGLPGCGKTVLAASYLKARRKPCLWYQIDEGDSDIATFFYYMGAAVRQILPRSRKPLPLFSPEFIQSVPAFTMRYFENLFGRFPTPFVVVMDNYQDIPAGFVFHEMMTHAIAVIPPAMQFVILSRKEPPPVFSRLRALNSIRFLRWDEIKFTQDEAREVVRTRVGADLPKDIFRHIYEKTDGWIAGLTLMIESARVKNIDQRTISALHPAQVFDYFAGEIFEKMEPVMREFLVESSFLPRMTAGMAEKLTGKKQAGRLLNDLHKNNCFTEVHGAADPVFQYHNLFREFLLSQAHQLFSRTRIARIRRTAARILEEGGEIEHAVNIYRDSGDWNGLTGIILGNVKSLISQGRYQTVEDWLFCLPESLRQENPELLYWEGMCRLPFEPDECRACLEKAFELFRKEGDVEGIFCSLSGIVESIMYGRSSLKDLDTWLLALEELLRKFGRFPSEDIQGRTVCSIVRAMSLRRPAFFPMDRWAERALDLTRSSKDRTMKTELLVHSGSFFYSSGKFQQMGIILDELRALIQHGYISPIARLNFLWLEAAHANATSCYDGCLKSVSDGLRLASETGIHVLDGILLGHGVLSSLKKGDLPSAKKFLGGMFSMLNIAKPWEVMFYHYCAAWEAMYRSDTTHAVNQSDICLSVGEEIGNPWTFHLAHLQKAYLLHEMGRRRKAEEERRKALKIGVESKNEFASFSCSIAEAYFALVIGEEEKAVRCLGQAIKTGREKGFVNVFMWPPGVMEKVCTKALGAGIEESFVREMIRKNCLAPGSAGVEMEKWPWPLKIYTLGRFDLLGNEKPLQFMRKKGQKPLLFLKALIALGGREVREQHISDLLWPEAEGDSAHSAFATTLSRLRHQLGSEHFIRMQEGRVFLDDRFCWVDAWTFERILERIEYLWRRPWQDVGAEAVRLADDAIGIYRGHFLASDTRYLWTISYRERLRVKFLRLILRMGEHLEDHGECKKAVGYYERALEVDDLAEEFYQQLMICYSRLGQSNEARATYRRCRKILVAVLGVEPSSRTEALYKTIVESEV